jgi:hypothetical protein
MTRHRDLQHVENAAASRRASALSRRAALKAGAAGLAAVLSLSHITPALAEELVRLAHGQPMTGARLATILRDKRARWDALLAQVRPDRLVIPGVEGSWSVKDLVAHLTWYEQSVVEGARQILSSGTFTRRRPAGVDVHEQNARIAAASQTRSVTEVFAEAHAVFQQMLVLVEACPDDLLNDPHVLGLNEDLVPWMGVANNSYGHYHEHEPALRAWLARQ